MARFQKKITSSLVNHWKTIKRDITEWSSANLSAKPRATKRGTAAWLNRAGAVDTMPLPSSTIPTDTTRQAETSPFKRRRRSALSSRMDEYAQKVVQLLQARNENDRGFKVFSEFGNLTTNRTSPGEKSEILDCWLLLGLMLQNFPIVTDQSMRAKLSKQDMLSGAKQFLEVQYVNVMNNCVKSNVIHSKPGGDPRFINKVIAFLRGQFESDWDRMSQEQQLWPQLYCCIRAGKIKEAKVIAKKLNMEDTLRGYVNNTATRPQMESRRIARNPARPDFERAVHSILSHCNVSIPTVFSTTQDWLWFKLSQIKPGTGSSLHQQSSRYQQQQGQQGPTLDDLCQLIKKCGGAEHFNRDGKNPLLYFQVLLITQQFERALAYLVANDQYLVDAVHFAIALRYVNVLRLAKSLRAPLYDAETNSIHFVRLLRKYVRKFSLTDTLIALHYYALVLNPQLRQECIKDLVLETRDFSLLLGGLKDDGTSEIGAIKMLINDDNVVNAIVACAAEDCERRGAYEDAIKLYNKANSHARVLIILNKRLSQLLVVHGGEREKLVGLANVMRDRYLTGEILQELQRLQCDQLVDTFALLLNLALFFDLYDARDWGKALAQLESCNVVPFGADEQEEKEITFSGLSEDVRRNFSEILSAAMECLFHLYKQANQSEDQNADMRYWKAKAKALIGFAGRIDCKIPDKLIQMETQMY
eukprot:TRINITY_DN7518_c0_g1_i1.p1 TRINITY_DN7518_c0_g1~~TRINITY_DN7518_c0_g1_i1.p1  ORF type:complete len:802 (+),score=132.01 TRINITY_DN7518_c0_g1_i1:306-2408(+)